MGARPFKFKVDDIVEIVGDRSSTSEMLTKKEVLYVEEVIGDGLHPKRYRLSDNSIEIETALRAGSDK